MTSGAFTFTLLEIRKHAFWNYLGPFLDMRERFEFYGWPSTWGCVTYQLHAPIFFKVKVRFPPEIYIYIYKMCKIYPRFTNPQLIIFEHQMEAFYPTTATTIDLKK